MLILILILKMSYNKFNKNYNKFYTVTKPKKKRDIFLKVNTYKFR